MLPSSPILLGQYRPLDSFLHRLDTRAKLIPVLLVMVVGLMTASPWFYVALIGLLLLGLACSGVSIRTLLVSFQPIVLLVAVTFIYHIVFSDRQSTPVFDIFGFAITEGGLERAGFFSLRLLLFVAIAFLVTLTSSPSDLAEGLTKLLRPLERLRVPISDLGLIMFIAIRFIPILYEEFTTIRNAQAIRGVDFGGGLINRTRKTSAILIPVLLGAISRADELALAMEARGYRTGVRRSFYSKQRMNTGAWLFMVGAAVVTIGLYWITG